VAGTVTSVADKLLPLFDLLIIFAVRYSGSCQAASFIIDVQLVEDWEKKSGDRLGMHSHIYI